MERQRTSSALVLFDIDGTLVRRAGPHHRDALIEAVRGETGVAVTMDGVPVQGMLDQDIVMAMLRNAGVSVRAIRKAMPAVLADAQRIYAATCPNLRRKTCPGVRAALRRIERRGLPLGLVTGNLTRIALKKLECAGLKEYFRYGAFSEMGKTRASLVRLAIRQARDAGWIDRSSSVSLIGDHMNDIEAARLNRIRSIAVATGIASAGELAACAPDLLLPDLRSLKLEMLL